jgi:uncharacterized protein
VNISEHVKFKLTHLPMPPTRLTCDVSKTPLVCVKVVMQAMLHPDARSHIILSLLFLERTMHPSLNLDAVTVAQFCQSHHIRRLALFGSQLKGTAKPDSDIDLLVEFEPAHMPNLFSVAAMEIELSDLLGGKKIDLRTPEDLSKHFRDEVVRTAQVQYAL